MRQGKAQLASQPISQELSKFFNLLHRDCSRQTTYKESQLVFGSNLSVILSTSQHDSEQMEGTSLNGTSAVQEGGKGRVKASIREVIQELLRSQLAPVQVELVKLLEGLIEELEEQHQHRISQLIKTDHQSEAILDQQPHKKQSSRQAISHNTQITSQHLFQLIQMQQRLSQLQSDNAFLKNLIILANESYQSLEKKFFALELQKKGSIASTNHRTKSKISIGDIPTSNERSRSPRMRSYVALPKAEEVYRKMVKRVLRQGNHSHTIK